MRVNTFVLSVMVALALFISSTEGWKGGKQGQGCKGGYCWAYCSPFSDLWDWCYTTGGDKKDSKGYARCTETWHCQSGWNCNGPCALL